VDLLEALLLAACFDLRKENRKFYPLLVLLRIRFSFIKDKWTVVKDGKEHLEMVIVDAKVRLQCLNLAISCVFLLIISIMVFLLFIG
jgi:hypothetical protein